MATINREAIDTFISITGASEAVAIQALQAHGGDLNEAVNAHFSEVDRNVGREAPITAAAPPSDFMDIDDPPELERRGPSILSAAGLNPFSLLDPTIRRNLFDHGSLFDSTGAMGRAPFVSQPREVREIPIEVKDGPDNSAGHSGHGPRIEDVTDTLQEEGPVTRGTVIIDDEDEDGITGNLRGNQSSDTSNRPSAPQFDDAAVYENDIEEEMIRAAIEASKRDAELQNKQDLHDVEPLQIPSQHGDDDLEHAVSLSLKTAEEERVQQQQGLTTGAAGSSAEELVAKEELGKIHEATSRQEVGASDKTSLGQRKIEVGNSSIQDEVEESEEQPLVRQRSRQRSSASEEHMEVGEAEVSPVLSPPQSTVASQTRLNGNAFPDEWGGISSEEHDEAVMLEAAMFGGIPESGYRAPYAPHQPMGSGLDSGTWGAPRPPSPSLVAQRAIREQQDDEYLAALQADREKELRAMEEEKAAKEAALMEQRQKEEESQRKLQEEQELERQLAAKQASLPEEPPLDDENAVNLLVRMPDGSRHGRRFRKTDKLQSLFDFIDIGRVVKPGSYRLVRPFPRRAFSTEENSLTLNELGLTSKQEALFLELI
uniref:UBX domain-containing protein n=1 Tax=Opuntia streptacantha TaxID=393608 RepID=A0A7C8YKB5_OPUST